MDSSKLIARVKNILLTPREEWPVIAAEPETVGGLYKNYIVLLAIIPAVAGFLKSSLIGTHVPLIGTVRIGIIAGLSGMIVQYVVSLAVVYLLALIVDALATTFGAQKNLTQALKTTVYASTASWIAGALILVPGLGWLLSLAGGIYSIYLLYLGLPATMKCAAEKATGYTVVNVICAVVMGIVVGAVVGMVTGFGRHGGEGSSIEIKSDNGGTLRFDSKKIEDFGKRMEAAGKEMDAAQKSGDQQAQAKAAGKALTAMLGNGEQVEALTSDQIKAFIPETLDGLPRASSSAERNTTLGIQVSTARASYHDEKATRTLDLEISDLGGAKGFAALAGWAAQESEKQTDTGYEHIYHDGDRIISEKWDHQSNRGTYAVVLGQRFSVKLQGSAGSMDELKELVSGLDLAGLEALKQSGVKPAGG
jgi:hypothetical protein